MVTVGQENQKQMRRQREGNGFPLQLVEKRQEVIPNLTNEAKSGSLCESRCDFVMQ